MRILITGGNGYIGQVVAQHFSSQGWDVRALDLQATANIAGIDYVQCDITNYDDVCDAICGCDAVVHLAAIPTPATDPGPTVFRVNATGTFNIFEAAAKKGIRRIAQASSINALGCAWGPNPLHVDYFPIDEDHPINPADPYSFSKQVIEDIGAYYWRRDGISSVGLRLPWVWTNRLGSKARQWRENDRAIIDTFAALPADERAQIIDDAHRFATEFRHSRIIEYPVDKLHTDKTRYDERSIQQMYTFDRFNFWTVVDVRDAAQAFEKGLTADYEGSHALFINATENWLGYDSQTLTELFYPDVTQRKKPLVGAASLVSIERARELIGFEPEYSPRLFIMGEADPEENA